MPRVLLLLCLTVVPAVAQATTVPSPISDPCGAAIAQVEREFQLPPRLLAAIGRVESGRREPTTGRLRPWPWTINAEGRGSFFPDKPAAIAAVQALQAAGMRSIDVGCMQVNLRHHPTAFATLEEAFDPLSNARYAARFLGSLHAARGDWLLAAGNYHSGTPERADGYRARVAAAWAIEGAAPPVAIAAAPPTAPAPAPPAAFRPSQPGGGFNLDNGAARMPAPIVTASGGGAGRGLDAYRNLPIPLAGRMPALPARL